ARQHEGLPDANGLLSGEKPSDFVDVIENGIRYQINIIEGQKSGFYCDQRDNRALTAQYVRGKRVLDCFCYTGGFTFSAFKSLASAVVSVDSTALAIETLQKN